MGGCCSSENNKWPQDFEPTALSSNKCDAEWETTTGTSATFGMGSAWGPAARFGGVPGVIRVSVGWAGGTEENPSYDDPKDYVEVVSVQFDPGETTYSRLVRLFFAAHECSEEGFNSVQYASVIFYHDDHQRHAAECVLVEMIQQLETPVRTRIIECNKFVPAPGAYQHLLLQQKHPKIFSKLKIPADMLHWSHLATKVEGYVTGWATPEEFELEADQLFLPRSLATKIRNICEENQPPEYWSTRKSAV